MKVPLFPVSVGASDFSCYWPFSGISYDIILCTYNNLCSCGVFNGGCPRGQFSAFCLFLRNIFFIYYCKSSPARPSYLYKR